MPAVNFNVLFEDYYKFSCQNNYNTVIFKNKDMNNSGNNYYKTNLKDLFSAKKFFLEKSLKLVFSRDP